MHSKGFLKPDDICTVDMKGNQIAGRKKRSSEALLHLEIYKQRSDLKSVVHCHPPHATAFAVAREPIPQCVLPEVEIFIGDVPITKYAIPGGEEFANTILPFVEKSNVIILDMDRVFSEEELASVRSTGDLSASEAEDNDNDEAAKDADEVSPED